MIMKARERGNGRRYEGRIAYQYVKLEDIGFSPQEKRKVGERGQATDSIIIIRASKVVKVNFLSEESC